MISHWVNITAVLVSEVDTVSIRPYFNFITLSFRHFSSKFRCFRMIPFDRTLSSMRKCGKNVAMKLVITVLDVGGQYSHVVLRDYRGCLLH